MRSVTRSRSVTSPHPNEARTTVLLDEIVTLVAADARLVDPRAVVTRTRTGARGNARRCIWTARRDVGGRESSARSPQHGALSGALNREAASTSLADPDVRIVAVAELAGARLTAAERRLGKLFRRNPVTECLLLPMRNSAVQDGAHEKTFVEPPVQRGTRDTPSKLRGQHEVHGSGADGDNSAAIALVFGNR